MAEIFINNILKHTCNHDFQDTIKRTSIIRLGIVLNEFEAKLRCFRQCKYDIFDKYIAIAKAIIIEQPFLITCFFKKHLVVCNIKMHKVTVKVIE